MPLVPGGGEVMEVPLSEAHERARKIDPRYARGRLVPVAGAQQQPEAEMIQGLLLDAGLGSGMSGSGRPDPRQVALVVGGIFGTGGFVALLIWVISHL